MQRTYAAQSVLTNPENTEEHRDLNILLEYRSLRAFAPSGVYVLPSIQDIYKWYGLLFIRGGEYQGAVFKFRIEIPNNYPASGPKLFFMSHVFHPLVNPETGELNTLPKFPVWVPYESFIFLLLSYMKYIFHNKDYWKDAKNILNSAAGSLFESDELQFQKEVRVCVLASFDDLQDDYDDFPIRLKQFNSFHKRILDEIKNTDSKASTPEKAEAFLSWFRKTFN